MSHVRNQIRDVLTTLLNTSPVNYKRAYNTRIPPMQQVWPYVLLWIENESIEDTTVNPAWWQMRTAVMTIDCRTQLPMRETESLENRLDDLATEIEQKLVSSASIAAVDIKNIRLLNTAMEVILDDDNNPSYGSARLTYEIKYCTNEGVPQTLI